MSFSAINNHTRHEVRVVHHSPLLSFMDWLVRIVLSIAMGKGTRNGVLYSDNTVQRVEVEADVPEIFGFVAGQLGELFGWLVISLRFLQASSMLSLYFFRNERKGRSCRDDPLRQSSNSIALTRDPFRYLWARMSFRFPDIRLSYIAPAVTLTPRRWHSRPSYRMSFMLHSQLMNAALQSGTVLSPFPISPPTFHPPPRFPFFPKRRRSRAH